MSYVITLIGKGGLAHDEFVLPLPQHSLHGRVMAILPGFYPVLPEFYPDSNLPGFYPNLPGIYPAIFLPDFYPECLPGIYPVSNKCAF